MLVYESSPATELDSPDNLTVTPRGGLIACEDDASSAFVDTHPLAPGIENVNRLIGITQRGQAFELAVNVLNGSELAGVCFSPSGRTLFFNLFGRATFDGGPGRGDDVRRHRAVAPGPALGTDDPGPRARAGASAGYYSQRRI